MEISFSSDIAWQLIGDNVFIKKCTNGMEFLLTEVSKEIWMMIDEGFNREDLVKKLQNIYNLEDVDICNDVNCFVDQLIQSRLITEGED